MSDKREAFEAFYQDAFECDYDEGFEGMFERDGNSYACIHVDEAWGIWQAAQSVPGFVLVPVEPTSEMIEAAREHHEGEPYLPRSLYKAMIEKAQEKKNG